MNIVLIEYWMLDMCKDFVFVEFFEDSILVNLFMILSFGVLRRTWSDVICCLRPMKRVNAHLP
jgi:hypothetical protein